MIYPVRAVWIGFSTEKWTNLWNRIIIFIAIRYSRGLFMQAGAHCRLEIRTQYETLSVARKTKKKGFMYIHNLSIIRPVKNITRTIFSKIKTNLLHYNPVEYDNPKTLRCTMFLLNKCSITILWLRHRNRSHKLISSYQQILFYIVSSVYYLFIQNRWGQNGGKWRQMRFLL